MSEYKELFDYKQAFLDSLVRSANLQTLTHGLLEEVKTVTNLSPIDSKLPRPAVTSVILTHDPLQYNFLSFPFPTSRHIHKLMSIINSKLGLTLNSCVVNFYDWREILREPTFR